MWRVGVLPDDHVQIFLTRYTTTPATNFSSARTHDSSSTPANGMCSLLCLCSDASEYQHSGAASTSTAEVLRFYLRDRWDLITPMKRIEHLHLGYADLDDNVFCVRYSKITIEVAWPSKAGKIDSCMH